MTSYLVTGGAGFIGSHLCEALVARGDSVRVIDDLSTGHRHNLPPGVPLIVGDVADPDAVARAMEGVDGCFHLAAIASVEQGVTDWLGTHRANLTGTITVFDAIRRQGSRIPVVYASSAAVYGDAAHRADRRNRPCPPLSAYGADKYRCELHARVASHVHGIPTVGLRFFNVYGPRQDPKSPYSGVISIFCERISAGQPITSSATASQTRDFVYVGDVVGRFDRLHGTAACQCAGFQRLHRHSDLGRGAGQAHRRSRRTGRSTRAACRRGRAKSGTRWGFPIWPTAFLACRSGSALRDELGKCWRG